MIDNAKFSGGSKKIEQCATLDPSDVVTACYTKLSECNFMDARKPEIEIIGPAAVHNQACAVLHRFGESAVLNMSLDAFEPSWRAQEQGFHLVFANTAFKRWLVRTFLK